MGDTISTLVFRPPSPTPIDPSDFFFLNIPNNNNSFNDVDTSFCAPPLTCLSHSDQPNQTLHRIPAFFVRRRGARLTLLFSHGNAEDLGMMYHRMKDLAYTLHMNVMAYDYTGYGLSEGDGKGPSEEMIYRNIDAAYDHLVNGRGISPRSIVLYGRSLGSGPSCYLAAKLGSMGERSVGGLILHSPFLSVYKVVADVWGMDVRGDMFHNEKRAKDIRCPTLIIHGKLDEVVPFWHAPRLLNAIPHEFRAQPFYVEGLGHNNIETKERARYIQAISSFLTKYVSSMEEDEVQRHRLGEERDGVDRRRENDQDCQSPPSNYIKIIPENERATTVETEKRSSFYVNQLWIRYAKAFFAEVVSQTVICNSVNSAQGSRGNDDEVRIRKPIEGDKYRFDDRDDDEFAPWMGEDRQGEDKIVTSRQGSIDLNDWKASRAKNTVSLQMKRQGAGWNREQKQQFLMNRYSTNSGGMPVVSEGGNGIKIEINSARGNRAAVRGVGFGGSGGRRK